MLITLILNVLKCSCDFYSIVLGSLYVKLLRLTIVGLSTLVPMKHHHVPCPNHKVWYLKLLEMFVYNQAEWTNVTEALSTYYNMIHS